MIPCFNVIFNNFKLINILNFNINKQLFIKIKKANYLLVAMKKQLLQVFTYLHKQGRQTVTYQSEIQNNRLNPR